MQEFKQTIVASPHHKASYKFIGHNNAASPKALKRDDGTFVTEPKQMDALLREKW